MKSYDSKKCDRLERKIKKSLPSQFLFRLLADIAKDMSGKPVILEFVIHTNDAVAVYRTRTCDDSLEARIMGAESDGVSFPLVQLGSCDKFNEVLFVALKAVKEVVRCPVVVDVVVRTESGRYWASVSETCDGKLADQIQCVE